MELSSPNRVCFGAFELDLRAGELHKGARKILLQEQPFQILQMLVERSGDLVTREEIRKRLWPNDTVVEFDHSIHTAINKLRQALGDSAERPKYLETVARRGYRLMVPVEWRAEEPTGGSAPDPPTLVQPATSFEGNLVGKRVSHYRVLEVISGGGMGLVYKAEDIKLGRRVALKFLPHEMADDPLSLGRFEREARAASALDHPNICAVHEFSEHEGQHFIVMQLLEGQTLRELIENTKPTADVGRAYNPETRLPLETLLGLALQITTGLEAAHEKGIIHRDIKPANLFITDRGEAKILDFGLAKVESSLPFSGGADSVPEPKTPLGDVDPSLTRTGVAVGTASYMSPEQVRGERLDARTDVFSFGLVLYELATGRQTFAGATAAVVHDAILHRTPVAVRELSPKIPPKLEAIIGKALEKDREQRYQSAAEMHADLESLRKLAHPNSYRFQWALAIAAAFIVLLVGDFMVRLAQRPPVFSPKIKIQQLTSNLSEIPVRTGAISPDGKYLAYTDLREIHVKALATGETNTVPQLEEFKDHLVNWEVVCWLPDGTRFFAQVTPSPERYSSNAHSSIWSVSVLGGTPRLLRDNATVESVSPDGALMAFTTNWGEFGPREIWLMSPAGENARKLWETDANSGLVLVRWSPDGQSLAYIRPGPDTLEIRDLKGGPPKTVMSFAELDFHDFLWLPDGRILYAVADPAPNSVTCNYWQMRTDPRTNEPIEKPMRVTNWAGFCVGSNTVTADGKHLAFLEWAGQTSVYVADLDASGSRATNPRRLTLGENYNYPFAWLPDRKSVLFVSFRENHLGIFRQVLDQDKVVPVVIGHDAVRAARLSPDGKSILYMIQPDDGRALAQAKVMRIPIDGGQSEFVLTAKWSPRLALTEDLHWPFACAKAPSTLCVLAEPSEDGYHLIFTVLDPMKGRGRELTQFTIAPEGDYVWDLSPDGTSIAIVKSSEARISLLPLSSQKSKEISVKGWNTLDSVAWTQNGKGLLVSSRVPGASVLLHVDLLGNSVLLWKQEGGLATYCIPSPDGRHLAMLGWNLNSNMWMMENF